MITDVIQKGIEIVKAEYQKALDENPCTTSGLWRI